MVVMKGVISWDNQKIIKYLSALLDHKTEISIQFSHASHPGCRDWNLIPINSLLIDYHVNKALSPSTQHKSFKYNLYDWLLSINCNDIHLRYLQNAMCWPTATLCMHHLN